MQILKQLTTLLGLFVAFESTMSAEINFSADFDCGSLGKVERLEGRGGTICYRVTSRVDPKNPVSDAELQSSRWFYYLVTGVAGQTLSIETPRSDFYRPMYSYDGVHFERYSQEECPKLNGRFTKHCERDSLYIAYFTPYSTVRNEEQMQRWADSPNVERFVMGETTLGTPLEAMVITQNPHKGLILDSDWRLHPSDKDRTKKVVYIHGRVHPSESPSSWNLESLIDRIVEDDCDVLSQTIFYVLPIANPDGVRLGLSRTNPQGYNIEANYDESKHRTSAEAASVKQLLRAIQRADLQLDICLNMHSQSTPSMTYWLHTADSTSELYNRRIMHFAALTLDQNALFKWRNLSSSTLRNHFVEGWLGSNFNPRPVALTYETPYAFYDRNPNGEWVTIESLSDQARHCYYAIVDALCIGSTDRIIISEPKRSRGYKRIKDNSYIFFGGSFLRAKRHPQPVVFRAHIPQGNYAIYRWIVAPNELRRGSLRSEWHYIGRHTQPHDGEFTYHLLGSRVDVMQLRRIE